MSGLPWFKCFPRAFNDGMMGMPPEERGIYVTVLNLIYERGAPIPDNAGWIASYCCCSVRTWNKVRASLIVKGKLFELNLNGEPSLMNRRAADEIAAREGIVEKRSAAGSNGGRQTQAKRQKNNDLGEANAKQVPEVAKAIEKEKTEEETPQPPKGGDADEEPEKPTTEPVDEARIAFDAWNDLATRTGLPVAMALDDARRRSIGKRLKEAGLDGWRQALAGVERSAFLRGQRPGSDGRTMRADLGFVCQAKSFPRLREGFYGDDAKNPKAVVALDIDPDLVAARHLRHFRDTGEWRDGWGPRPNPERLTA